MKKFLFPVLIQFFVTIHSTGTASAIDPGVAVGALQVNEKKITLRHAYAHLRDNAEGLLDHPKELRVLLTDREVPPDALVGIAFLPVTELARQGQAQGLLFEMDPGNPNEVVMTLLYPPKETGQMLIRQTLSVTGKELFNDWSYASQRVTGAIEHRDEDKSSLPEFPAISYSVRFNAQVFDEPPITADLKGKAAHDSPQARVLSELAEALSKGDIATARKLSSERASHRSEGILARVKADFLVRQAAEMKKAIQKIQRVVERGDYAVAICPGKQWFTLVREGGEWKADN